MTSDEIKALIIFGVFGLIIIGCAICIMIYANHTEERLRKKEPFLTKLLDMYKKCYAIQSKFYCENVAQIRIEIDKLQSELPYLPLEIKITYQNKIEKLQRKYITNKNTCDKMGIIIKSLVIYTNQFLIGKEKLKNELFNCWSIGANEWEEWAK